MQIIKHIKTLAEWMDAALIVWAMCKAARAVFSGDEKTAALWILVAGVWTCSVSLMALRERFKCSPFDPSL